MSEQKWDGRTPPAIAQLRTEDFTDEHGILDLDAMSGAVQDAHLSGLSKRPTRSSPTTSSEKPSK